MEKQCELCGCGASLYCDSDEALLCWSCDASVHGANFLVARHVRRVACAECRAVDAGACVVSGAVVRPFRSLCSHCDGAEPSSSSCLSAAESTTASRLEKKRGPSKRRGRRRQFGDERAKRVLNVWSGRMGLKSARRCTAAAARLLSSRSVVIGAKPGRVALAAALWSAVKLFARHDKGDDDVKNENDNEEPSSSGDSRSSIGAAPARLPIPPSSRRVPSLSH
ncbi:B-box zinc finger protein 32-like [Curcuma longa]|uniref:B-box zinc finger protein 32-like n=1 Tax=Curcuma longa TaxID=136217 RepID=UPI003D9DC12B